MSELNLGSAEGLRGFLAASLKQLAQLPFDSRIANAISSLANTQRGLIEASVFEQRLAALENAPANRHLKRA